MALRERLAAKLAALGGGGDPAATAAALAARYEEPHRQYHTLVHIEDCLLKLDAARGLLDADEADAVELALAWHDAVYDPQAADNEEKSAALFRDAAVRHRLEPRLVAAVDRLILQTKAHVARNRPDEQVMVDIDLSILGAPLDVFAAYDRSIRREYTHIPEPAWRERRAKVLRSFLLRDPLFATRFFRERYETTARRNLAQAIAALEQVG
jgi:predicted metal-dependent HD superfamily phosphohydrolase